MRNENNNETKGTKMAKTPVYTIEEVTTIFCRTTRFLMDRGLTEEAAKAKAKEIMTEAANQVAKDSGSDARL